MTVFPKSNRLLAKPQFNAVLENGLKVVCRDFVLIASIIIQPDRLNTRLGLIVSRKVGDSVQRNRVKRCVREVFRAGVSEVLQGRDLVVIARPSLNSGDGKIHRDVAESFSKCLARLTRTLKTPKKE
ncbi:MAG: ribonuclease P protein component [Proteobacteria bacterium]|nr:ribonuclease P protein component [Pseudomonadota bacterium]